MDHSTTLPRHLESGGAGMYRIVASKREGGVWPVPPARRDLCRG